MKTPWKRGWGIHHPPDKILFLVLILSTTLLASPVRDSTTCGPSYCSSESSEPKFQYKEGSVYSYIYTVNGTSSVLGGPPTQSGLHLAATVSLRFLTACDVFLFMSNVSLFQSHLDKDSTEHAFTLPLNRLPVIKSLEQHPLRFSYADGLIEEICPHSEESSWALNIKRGFLSAFQNTMRRLDLEHEDEEDDVHGSCKVKYKLGLATSSELTIQKTKDLSSCGNKFGILSSVKGSPYTFGKLHQSMPAVESISSCKHVVDRNLLSGVQCSESHRLRSLARGAAGAYMNIVQNLELSSVYSPPLLVNNSTETNGGDVGAVGGVFGSSFDDEDEEEENDEKPPETLGHEDQQLGSVPWIIIEEPNDYVATLLSTIPLKIYKRESLLFRHDYSLGQSRTDYDTARTALSNFCTSVRKEVVENAGELFEILIYILRGLSPNDMMSLSKDGAQICQGDREPLDDALEVVGTAASMAVLRERILRGDSSPQRTQSWIQSLNFIPKPDLSLMTEAVSMLRARDKYPDILLSFSNLANAYCSSVGQTACIQDQPVIILSKLYEKYFEATGCSTRKRKEVDQALVYLKGLGNFGLYSNNTIKAITTCILKSDKNEVRVVAIEALRRMSCENGAMLPLLKSIFENKLDDAEVRIAAFLAIMRCPSYPTIRWIKNALEVEEVNQVGSFVWTYLTNLQETALPSRAELAGLLSDEHFSTKFSTDIRKFSRNFEFSTFYEDVNLGLGLDGNLVFSQASYLPRSTSANLTVDLFGESINVFEATLRLESFEHYVESIWMNGKSRSGPTKSQPSTNLSSVSSSSNKRRQKRAVLSRRKMRNLTSEYDLMKRYHASDPTASFSLRTFGKEIYFRRWVGLDEQRSALSALNPANSFWMGGNNGEDTNWQKSRLVLDSSYIIPTGAGLPLNLSAQASTIIRLESQSLIDSSGSSGAFHVKGKFIPSALLAVAGSMTLSASDIHTGLKIRAHLRSSLALQGGIALKGMKLLDVEFGLPQTQLQLLEYKSELMFMEGEKFRRIGHGTKEVGSPQMCSGGLLYTSLRLCSSSHFSLHPKGVEQEDEDGEEDLFVPYFPLNGPSHFTLSLDKTNPSLLKTRFYYGWNNNQTATELSMITSNSILTTGESGSSGSDSIQETKLGFSFNLDKESPSFDTEIILPSTRFKATGDLGIDRTSGNLNITLERNQLTVFSTSVSLKRENRSDGKSIVRPIFIVTRNSQALLKGEGEIEFTPTNTNATTLSKMTTTFIGTGQLTFYGKRLNLQVSGGYNKSSLSLSCESRTSAGETTQLRSSISYYPSRAGGLWGGGLESQLRLQFSVAPSNNLETFWKYQVEEDVVNVEGYFIQGLRPEQKELDPSNICFRVGVLCSRSHEGSVNSGNFALIHPALGIHWSLGGALLTFGKSLNASINLVYAPGKSMETSVMVKRAPGVLTFLELGWNTSLPNRDPVQVSLHLQEKARGVFQSRLTADWQLDKLLLELEYSDKSRRSRLDNSISLGIATNSLDNLKLGFHILSEEKETKLQLSSDYKSQRYALELGHNQVGRTGKKHKFVGSMFVSEAVYVVMSELDLENGVHVLLKTALPPRFSDIYARITATSKGGMHTMGLEYRFDATHPTPKIFLAQLIVDESRKNVKRLNSVLTFPRYQVDGSAEIFHDPERKSGGVLGKLSWRMDDDEVGHLHLNGRLGPRREKDDEAFDAAIQLATPFPSLKNVSLHMELDFLDDGAVCQIKFDSSWRDEEERLGGTLLSRLERIQEEKEEQEGGESDEDAFSPRDDENEIDNGHNGPNPFKFSCDGNISSTITALKLVKFKLNHVFVSYLNTKTDLDIQLPNEKEISVSSQWVLPLRWANLLSTRAELHIKTPFVGYQNVDLQGILGRKEDRDVLALIGIYVESFQYAISISGTPRFEQDGALGFELTTSNAEYDKIFGRLSYVFGDTTRVGAGGLVACQLGWPPQVVVGVEVGWEWVHWGDFHVYHTITTPWVPIKHVVALLKVDATQSVELKLEANEDSIKGKCEWSALSWTNFDIRMDGNSPFETANKFGFVLKNSWDDDVAYDSQAIGWINEQQVGFKLDGGKSEVEEEYVVANVLNSQFELDTLVYPTIRALLSLAQRESKYDLALSLVLREGPINLDAKLDLLDMYRFNENITLTTPYPQLLQLEIGLSPAIIRDKGLYNLGIHSKWRSYAEWYTGGLWIRWGPQKTLSDVLTQEARNNALFTGEDDEDYEQPVLVEPVTVPLSQLFHFYSPLPWIKLVKMEYEGTGMETIGRAGVDEELDSGEGEIDEDILLHFPIRKFEVVYSGDMIDISSDFNNEPKKKGLMGVVDVRMSEDFHPSFKVDGLLDLSESERHMNLLLGSYSPHTTEYSVSSSWSSDLPQFLQGRVEVKSPFENWEEQSGSITFAHNENEQSYSVDLELSSITFDKLATNVMLGPRTFSMIMSTPLDMFNELELRGDITPKDGETGMNTLIVVKCGDKELELDVDAEITERGWPNQMTGTLSANFGPEAYRHGTLTGDLAESEGAVNASAQIQWNNKRDKLHANLLLLLTENQFQNMNLTMKTPFDGNHRWELTANRISLADQTGLEFNLQTPLPQLVTLHGQALVENDPISILELKKLTLQANTRDGILTANSSWSLSLWNKCSFGFETKYSLPILSSYNYAMDNGIKLRFQNAIPTLTHFTGLDSRFFIDTSSPPIRLGAGLTSEYQKGDSLSVKVNSKYGKKFANLDFTSTFDSDFDNFNISGRANATDFHSHATLELKEGRKGEAVVGWGDGRFLSSLVQSTFNCSSGPGVGTGSESRGKQTAMVHLHLDSNSANNTLTPLISIDGSFNRISARHSVRVQVEQGEDLKPIRLEMNLMLENFQHFSAALNFSSNFTSFSDTGLEVYNKKDGSMLDGYFDSHWEEDRFFLKYFWDHELNDDMFKFNISLDTVLPLSTESVPKPQNISITCTYARNSAYQSTESSFCGVYNGVQLVDSNYSTRFTNTSVLQKNELHFQLDNHFWPFGLISLNQFEHNIATTDGDQGGGLLPNKRLRRLELYDLNQPTLHKLEGELQIKTNFTGSEMTLTGRHPTRTVELVLDYSNLQDPGSLRQTSKLSWGPGTSWLGYELDLFNRRNVSEGMMEQGLGLRLTYPLRVITLKTGFNHHPSDTISKWKTELNFNAEKNPGRDLVGEVSWTLVPQQPGQNKKVWQFRVELKHPTLPKGLRADGRLEKADGWEWMEGNLVLDHTGNLQNGLKLKIIARPPLQLFSTSSNRPLTEGGFLPYYNFSTEANLLHPGTGLELKSGLWTLNSFHELSIITLIDFKNCKKSVPEESKIAFELFKQLRKAHIMLLDPEDYYIYILQGPLSKPGNSQLVEFVGEANISGINPNRKARISLDLQQPSFKSYAVYGKGLSNGVYAEGGVIDSRNVRFDVWQVVDKLRLPEVSYFLRLNHSRLITSQLKWRPELFSELEAYVQSLGQKLKNFAAAKGEQWKFAVVKDASDSASALWDDAKGSLEPFWRELTEECDFGNDSAALQFFLEEMYTHNEFYVQDVLGFSQLFLEEIFMRVSLMWEKMNSYRDELTNESVQALEAAVQWIKDSIKDFYQQLVTAWENYTADPWGRISSALSFSEIKEKLYLVCYYSIGFVVKVGEAGGEAVYHSLSSLGSSILLEISKIIQRYQPQILAHLHQIETFVYDFIVKMTDYLYERKEEVMKSQYYQKLAQLAHDVDDLYRDISKNDAVANIKKFYGMLKTFLARKLSEMDELVPLQRVKTSLASLWVTVQGWELTQVLRSQLDKMVTKISWLMEYTKLDEGIQDLLVLLYTQGSNLFSQTILQASARHQTAKTKFIFDADKGIISLEQKLPMPWGAFNETPNFQKLPEYESIVKWQDMLKSSKASLKKLMLHPWITVGDSRLDWLPPFDGHAMMVGPEHVLTFDGLSYSLDSRGLGLCNYVLVADLVDANFSVSLEIQDSTLQNRTAYNIFVTAGHNTLVLDMGQKGLRDPKRGDQLLNLPLQTPNLRGYQTGLHLVVESPKGIIVSCHILNQICQFHVSGWYSRKIGGLLGTMDEEPSTDLTTSSGRKGLKLEDMIRSWQFVEDSAISNTCNPGSNSSSLVKPQPMSGGSASKLGVICHKMYRRPTSILQPCFSAVNTGPFYDMCLLAEVESQTCTSVAAYLTACRTIGVPLQNPSICVKCEMNGEEMMDREMRVMNSPPPGSPPFLSTDIVFIVEAKECNRGFRTRRKIDTLAKHLEDQLEQHHFKQNRYAAVLFGGDGVFDQPRSVVQNNAVFTSAANIGKHVASLPTGNGTRDIFNAISYTLQHLNFRPSASKTLILFPCSHCQPQDLTVDYAELYYDMLEKGATLHTFLDAPFPMDNKNMAKKIFGIDSSRIYTKSDATPQPNNTTNGKKGQNGGGGSKSNAISSKRQVKVPKSLLGYCAPLALQTNGSIFTTKKLQNKQENMAHLFSTVFGDRVAVTAAPSGCQTCYCTSAKESSQGMGTVECFDCEYPRYELRPGDEDEDYEVSGSDFFEGNDSSRTREDDVDITDTDGDAGLDSNSQESDEDDEEN